MEHQGEILSIDGEEIVVRMSAGADECAGCAVAAFCSRPAEVTVPAFDGAEPGRRVLLRADKPLHGRAMWLLIAVPLALLIATLLECSLCGLPQWACGLAPLLTLAIWYAIVGLTAGRKAKFKIVKLL